MTVIWVSVSVRGHKARKFCFIITPMGSAPSSLTIEMIGPVVGSDRQDPYLRLQSITVFVRDIDRSLRFYTEQLGFALVLDARHHKDYRWVSVAPPDGTATLTLHEAEPNSPDSKLIGRSTRVVFVTEDVLAKFREWRSRGVEFSHTPRLKRLKQQVRLTAPRSAESSGPDSGTSPIWGGVFTRFRDVDGNSFTLAGFDELTREVEAQRRASARKREAELRAAQELEIATRVQARLFPQTLPALRTLDYAGVCVQARAVGGDYYDFLDLGQERVGLVIGDICGKGIAAALLMANLQANLRSQCATALDDPSRFLQCVNRLFCENTADTAFATLFFGEYDDRAQRLRYANCGHHSALLFRRDGTLDRLCPTATVLGLFADWECEVLERRLSPGDLLALYTDGITESFSPREEEFGEDRLIDALERHRELPCPDLLQAVASEVRRFSPQEQHDDITLIVARCRDS